MMAWFDRNVLRPRLPLLRPMQVLVVVAVLLAGIAVRTGANVACHQFNAGKDYSLVETDGKCPVPAMNAAFNGKLTGCSKERSVSRVCVCVRCVRCASAPSISPIPPIHIIWVEVPRDDQSCVSRQKHPAEMLALRRSKYL